MRHSLLALLRHTGSARWIQVWMLVVAVDFMDAPTWWINALGFVLAGFWAWRLTDGT